MPHKNRSPLKRKTPKPADIVAARTRAGLSVREASLLIYASVDAWTAWESGVRTMHPAFFELFLMKLKERLTNE